MKKLATAIAVTALIATPAFAADMAVKAPPAAPAPEVPSWTGFYIGVDAGGAWWSSKEAFSNFPPDSGAFLDPVNFVSNHQIGGVGGFLGGYNRQFGPTWVVGVEGDYNWVSWDTNVNTVATSEGTPAPGNNIHMSQSLDWLASARGRIGYVWGQSLWYATGGAAWEGVEYSGQVTFATSPFAENTPNLITTTKSGWVAGGGVEYMATPHVLLRLEYLYYGFPGFTTTAVCTPAGCDGNPTAFATFSWSNNNVQVVRAALSYKF